MDSIFIQRPDGGIIFCKPLTVKVPGLAIIGKGNGSRNRLVRADIVDIHVIDHLVNPKLLKLLAGNPGDVRKKPLDSAVHSRGRIGGNGLGIRNIMLIAYLNHLPVSLHRNQKLAA